MPSASTREHHQGNPKIPRALNKLKDKNIPHDTVSAWRYRVIVVPSDWAHLACSHKERKVNSVGDQARDIACWQRLLPHSRTCPVRMPLYSIWRSAKHGLRGCALLETGDRPGCGHTELKSSWKSLSLNLRLGVSPPSWRPISPDVASES
ncbi:hypothetical protein BJX70DRAFT_146861 [Aspergillus crustosus]